MLWLLITALSFNIVPERFNRSTIMHFAAASAGSFYLYMDSRYNWDGNTVFTFRGQPYPIKQKDAWTYSVAAVTAMGLAKEIVDGFNEGRHDGFSFTDFMADVGGALTGATLAMLVDYVVQKHRRR